MVSQPALLEMLVAEAAKFPCFELHRGVTTRDLVHDASGRVTGVRIDGAEGARELPADLVIGCDGRASLVRKRSGLDRPRDAQTFDVVWCKLPLPPYMHSTGRGCLGVAHFAIVFEAPDGLMQLGWAIEKGRYGDIRRAGIDAFVDELSGTLPADLSAWVRAHRAEISSPFLLDVVCDHLDVWSAPGVLLLGDAAHPMSPVGAQGINIALRDALVAANHLGPVLARNGTREELDAAARAVVAERLPEVVEIQALQNRPPPMLLQQTPFARFLMRWIAPFVLRSGLATLAMRSALPIFTRGTREVKLRF
jgi:2-polyprenyl-6-methoxyphenol hydroxylase-like FAD-dependent oxidoreductase